jgi:hypothetical protein
MCSISATCSVPALLLSALLFGCSATAPTVGSSAALSEADVAPISIHGKFVDYGTGHPFSGATICLDGTDTCVVTAADGTFSLQAAEGADLLVVASAGGYTTNAFPLHFDTGSQVADIGAYFLVPTPIFEHYVQVLSGQPYDPSKGVAMVNVASSWPVGSFLGGATVSYTPVEHVVYSNENGIPDLNMTSTTVGGRALASVGNVSPGEVAAQVSLPGKTCSAFQGWSSSTGNIRVPILANAIVSVIAVCQ